MSIKTVPMYTYECDWEGCELTADDGGDFVAWAEEDMAMISVDGAGWEQIGGLYYCDEHWHVSDDDELIAGPQGDQR